jgi:hypothetical protein
MKKLFAAVALTVVTYTAPAFADVGISLRIGEPGFYGQLDIGNYGSPRLLYSQPLIVVERYRNPAPIYLRVPPAHSRQWNRYCGRYNACDRPAYFVRDEWYRAVYVPRHRQRSAWNRHDARWDGRHDHRHHRRDERRGERHRQNGRNNTWR